MVIVFVFFNIRVYGFEDLFELNCGDMIVYIGNMMVDCM